jgi:hypothetical protein
MDASDPAHPTTTSRPRSNAQRVPPRHARTIALLLAFTVFAPRTVSAGEVRDGHPNLIAGELGGRGFIVTANYERFLTDHFALGAGATLWPIVSLYAAYLPEDTNSLYLAVGGTFVGGGVLLDSHPISLLLQGSVGYQFQSANGFFVRPLVTLNVGTAGEDIFPVWPGVTIGRSF